MECARRGVRSWVTAGPLCGAAFACGAVLACGAVIACGALLACGAAEPRLGLADGGGVFFPSDAGVPACRGNNDGIIARDELVFVPGVSVRYRVNPPDTRVAVDVKGMVRADGTHLWDFSDGAGDAVELGVTRAQDGWYARDFADAQYASRLDPRAPLLGLYRAFDDRLELLGVVGETEGQGTRLKYDVPVPLLRFPLSVGRSWDASANVIDGRLENLPIASRDRYQIAVDAVGELRLGILTFPRAVRVRVELVQSFPAGPGSRRIQYLWMTECYGEVARVTSKNGELDPEFREAVEYRRLSF